MWQNAPEWAHYYTVDERGAAYWWEDEPFYRGDRWWDSPTTRGRTKRADNDGCGKRCEMRAALQVAQGGAL